MNYIYQVKNGSKKPRKVKLSKVLKFINETLFQSQLFVDKEKAIKYIKIKNDSKLRNIIIFSRVIDHYHWLICSL